MSTKYEMSKTYQYRKVVKPLLERKRRARINKCLDDLKDLIAEFMQQDNNETIVKLEKADILEVTVNHLRKLKAQQQNKKNVNHHHHHQQHNQNSFRSGYIQAANEVSRCLASLPKVDIIFGRRLMTHLGERLNQLEAKQQKETPTPTDKPLKINCLPSQQPATSFATQLHSPVSSGYGSDSDSSRSSPSLYAERNDIKVWRPW